MMQLSTTGRLYQLYWFTYGREPSNNLCDFFWKELFAIVIFPFTWLSFPFDAKSVFSRIFASVVAWFFTGAVAFLIAMTYTDPWTTLYAFTIIATIVVGAALIMGIGAACMYLSEERPWEEIEVPVWLENVREVKRSFKDKYCPRIEWK